MKGPRVTAPLDDMHCHLDFVRDPAAIVRNARAAGSSLFANTVTPAGYERAQALLADLVSSEQSAEAPVLRLGCGFHPWYASPDALDDALEQIDACAFVGEVGMDFGARGICAPAEQVRLFSALMRRVARSEGTVVSIHSVGAARETLDVLEETGALARATCVFHWFSGPSDQLKRAIDAGCWFSVGPLMAASRRGRAYIQAIPLDRMLLETDAPPTPAGTVPACPDRQTAPAPDVNYTFADLSRGLARACAVVREVKGAQIAAHPNRYPRRLRDADPADILHENAVAVLCGRV